MSGQRLVEIKGIPEVERKLREMPKLIVGAAFAKAFEAAAAVIMAEVAARTPERDEGDRNEEQTHLIEALTFDTAIDIEGRGGRVSIGFGREGLKAMWVEYGHRLVGHQPGDKQIGVVPAHPFMRPAADACAEAAVEAFTTVLEQELKRIP